MIRVASRKRKLGTKIMHKEAVEQIAVLVHDLEWMRENEIADVIKNAIK
jgi:hypothetical protein